MYFKAGERPLAHAPLTRLMALYEQNYLNMRLLVPGLASLQEDEYWSRLPDCLDLRLRLLERSRYTTTVNLSYVFSPEAGKVDRPDLCIRVYHDARSAEAMSGLIHGNRLERREVRDLQRSWTLNRFLYKWLRYNLHRGHKFNRADGDDVVQLAHQKR
ncbi:MAG: DUF1249 domain-containing protein [Pseudomonadota bacterium]